MYQTSLTSHTDLHEEPRFQCKCKRKTRQYLSRERSWVRRRVLQPGGPAWAVQYAGMKIYKGGMLLEKSPVRSVHGFISRWKRKKVERKEKASTYKLKQLVDERLFLKLKSINMN